MKGSRIRDKGRRGQTAAMALLRDRDWIVADLASGVSSEDGLATDPDGVQWSVEAKNTTAITRAHRKQAMEQAKARKARWCLISRIAGTRSWLVQRQGCAPVVWRDKVEV